MSTWKRAIQAGYWPSQDTYLAPELLVSREVPIMAKGLLEEGQQDGDNDARFQCLTEQDEEDCWIAKMCQHRIRFSGNRKCFC